MGTNVTGLNIPMDFQSLSLIEQIYRSVLIPSSFVINTGVFCVIIYSRQLHYPRHIFWAAVALLNIFSTFHWIFELLGIVLHLSFACRAYVLNAGVTYTLLLNCLCLATIDRYMVIAYYDWYKENISNRVVVSALVCSSFITYATGTSPFWSGILSLSSCTVNLTHVHWLLVWDLILGITCVILDFKIFVLSRELVRNHIPTLNRLPMAMTFVQPSYMMNQQVDRCSSASEVRGADDVPAEHFISNNHEVENIPQGQINEKASSRATEERVSSKKDYVDQASLSYRKTDSHAKKKCNRLETRTALSFSINILPFWLCTFPITLGGISLYWCVYLQLNCPTIIPMNVHLKHLFFIHHIYTPTSYVFTTKEFQRACLRFVSRFKIYSRSTTLA